MTDDKNNFQCSDPECQCGCQDGEECKCGIEIIELEDENGDNEEWAILEEFDFEGRRFAFMALLSEVERLNEIGETGDDEDPEVDIGLEIFEVKDDVFTMIDDEKLAQSLMEYLDKQSKELEGQG